mmetsp:Transcript_40211/g.94131  ORF Transcript_40211/g.94131 Transcript_40211/m.94131 type:complete len:128 (+) Transcript_40211:1629-2012(+)
MQFPDPDVSSLRLVDGAPLISVLDASVGYTMGGVLKSVLHNVNLQLTAKSRVAVVGDNGAGKTTLLRLLGGELQPIKGKGMGTRQQRSTSVTSFRSRSSKLVPALASSGSRAPPPCRPSGPSPEGRG